MRQKLPYACDLASLARVKKPCLIGK